jgi:hypothetical protein
MAHRLKLRQRTGPHALRRRIGREQFGMGGFQCLQFLEQAVVFGVRDAGLVEDVIAVVVAVQFVAQHTARDSQSGPLRAVRRKTSRLAS